MKNFVSKGLVAAAVATACAAILPGTIANASSFVAKAAGDNHSREGLVASASNVVVSLGAVSFVTGNTLFNGDRYKLTLSAGTMAGANNANPATDVVCGAEGSGGVFALEFQAFSGREATYLVKGISGTTNAKSCSFLSLGVQASSIATASTVTITASKAPFGSQTYNEDTAAAAHMLSTSLQYSLSLQAAWDGEVNYTATNSGLNFSGVDDSLDGNTGNSDVIHVKLQSANLLSSVGTAGSVRFVVTATKDFKFLDNNGDGVCTGADLSVSGAKGVFVASGTGNTNATYSINSQCTIITVESSGANMPVNGGEFTLSLAVGRDTAAASVTTGIKIEPQDFANTSLLVTRSSAGGSTSSATYDAGA